MAVIFDIRVANKGRFVSLALLIFLLFQTRHKAWHGTIGRSTRAYPIGNRIGGALAWTEKSGLQGV
jgi:hypothetical protein